MSRGDRLLHGRRLLSGHDYLDSGCTLLEKTPDLGFIGGRFSSTIRRTHTITIQETPCDKIFYRRFSPAGLIHGANFACRREGLGVVNGFDERWSSALLWRRS